MRGIEWTKRSALALVVMGAGFGAACEVDDAEPSVAADVTAGAPDTSPDGAATPDVPTESDTSGPTDPPEPDVTEPGACVGAECLPAAVCPPPGPHGVEPRDLLSDLTVYDCDGNPKTLHSLCGADAGYFNLFAAWCPGCQAFVKKMDGVLAGIAAANPDADFDYGVILIEDSNGDPPSAAFCKTYRDQAELQMPVYFDPDGVTSVYGYKETSVVSNESGRITFKIVGDYEQQIVGAVEAELAAPEGYCSGNQACAEGALCLPTPMDDGKACATTCSTDDAAACPEGLACHSYGNSNGACFPEGMVP